jgi:hypothetical protein
MTVKYAGQVEEWQCPRHPGLKTIRKDEYIEDMLPI